MRRRRHLVEAGDAHDLLDEIGCAVDVRPPARRRHLHGCALALDGEAQPLEGGQDLALFQPDAAELLDLRRAKPMTVLASGGAPATLRLDGVPPATSSIMAVARSRPGRMNAGSTPRSKR